MLFKLSLCPQGIGSSRKIKYAMLYINEHMYISAQILLITHYLGDTVRLMLAHNIGFPPWYKVLHYRIKMSEFEGVLVVIYSLPPHRYGNLELQKTLIKCGTLSKVL